MSNVGKHLGLVEEQNLNAYAEAEVMGIRVGHPERMDEL